MIRPRNQELADHQSEFTCTGEVRICCFVGLPKNHSAYEGVFEQYSRDSHHTEDHVAVNPTQTACKRVRAP